MQEANLNLIPITHTQASFWLTWFSLSLSFSLLPSTFLYLKVKIKKECGEESKDKCSNPINLGKSHDIWVRE